MTDMDIKEIRKLRGVISVVGEVAKGEMPYVDAGDCLDDVMTSSEERIPVFLEGTQLVGVAYSVVDVLGVVSADIALLEGAPQMPEAVYAKVHANEDGTMGSIELTAERQGDDDTFRMYDPDQLERGSTEQLFEAYKYIMMYREFVVTAATWVQVYKMTGKTPTIAAEALEAIDMSLDLLEATLLRSRGGAEDEVPVRDTPPESTQA